MKTDLPFDPCPGEQVLRAGNRRQRARQRVQQREVAGEGHRAGHLPLWDIDVAGYYNIRQGYPFPQGILTPNRPNQGGQTTVSLGRMGEVRLDKFQNADIRIGQSFTFGPARVSPSLDIFNVGNVNTIFGSSP